MNKEECNKKVSWDYLGYKTNQIEIIYRPDTQNDWNQTLSTMLNQCSAYIHLKNTRGGANRIRLNSEMFKLISTLEFFNEETNTVNGKFVVIVDNSITTNQIFVYNADALFRTMYIPKFEIGETTTNDDGSTETEILGLSYKDIFECTEEEIIEFRRDVCACIEILNY